MGKRSGLVVSIQVRTLAEAQAVREAIREPIRQAIGRVPMSLGGEKAPKPGTVHPEGWAKLEAMAREGVALADLCQEPVRRWGSEGPRPVRMRKAVLDHMHKAGIEVRIIRERPGAAVRLVPNVWKGRQAKKRPEGPSFRVLRALEKLRAALGVESLEECRKGRNGALLAVLSVDEGGPVEEVAGALGLLDSEASGLIAAGRRMERTEFQFADLLVECRGVRVGATG